jgi:hypothetical protein
MDRLKCIKQLEYADSGRARLGILRVLSSVRGTRQPKLARQKARGSFGREKRICVDSVWDLRTQGRPDAQ